MACTDNTVCLKQVIGKKIGINKAIHVLFVDQQMTYDNKPITKLWEILQNTYNRIESYTVKCSLHRCCIKETENTLWLKARYCTNIRRGE